MSGPARRFARSRPHVAGHMRRLFAGPGVGRVAGPVDILLQKAPAPRRFEGGEP